MLLAPQLQHSSTWIGDAMEQDWINEDQYRKVAGGLVHDNYEEGFYKAHQSIKRSRSADRQSHKNLLYNINSAQGSRSLPQKAGVSV